MGLLTGKTALITGAARGIGKAIALKFAEEGANIAFTDLVIDENGEATHAEIEAKGVKCAAYASNAADFAQTEEVVKKVHEDFGSIDILVNNAGISMRAMFKDLDLKVIHRLMDVNFWGTVNCTKYALPYLLETKGSVVGVISIAGYSALPARTGYSSSKYAIRGFLDTIRIEHLYDGLHVMVFAPGYTSSNVRNAALVADGSAQGETPLDEGKLMSAEECAEYLAKGLRKRRSEMILTGLGKVTVLAHRLFPRLTDKLTYSFIAREAGSPFHKE